MTVLQVLSEVIGSKELFRLIALAKFMYILKMLSAFIPIRSWIVGKLLATIAASIKGCERIQGGLSMGLARASICRWNGGGGVKSGVVVALESGARPGMTTEVEGVLVTLSLVLILEAITTERTLVLFFRFVIPRESDG